MAKDTFFYQKKSLNLNGKLFFLDEPAIMGILNLSSDSFYDGGKFEKIENALKQVEKMLDEGADIIDIGAFTSKPGAVEVSEDRERTLLIPVVKAILKTFPNTLISVDTYRSKIAHEVVQEGCSFINDISGGEMDKNMFETIGKLKVPYILMHMKGTPSSMQNKPTYENVTSEIIQYLAERTQLLKEYGANDVIVDPGFGFGKTLEHNFEILNYLSSFKLIPFPILVGISRKSMIYKTLDGNPNSALNGTTALQSIALLKNAQILRVHDVKEAKEVVKLVKKLN